MQHLNKPQQQYYLKSRNLNKETKFIKSPQSSAQSSLSLIYKMNSKSKLDQQQQIPSSERVGKNKLQTSPKMANYFSASSLLNKTSQSPKTSVIDLLNKKQSKECPSRISHDEGDQSNGGYLSNMMQMEERRKQLSNFKELIGQNQQKLQQLFQLQIQTELIQTQLNVVIKSITLLKEQLIQQVQQEQQQFMNQLTQIKESMNKMEDDILYNEQNIIESMQMKPFVNIMGIYQKRVLEHSNQISQMISKNQSLISFNNSCQNFLIKLQSLIDPKEQHFPISEKENNSIILNKAPESPCFRKNS